MDKVTKPAKDITYMDLVNYGKDEEAEIVDDSDVEIISDMDDLEAVTKQAKEDQKLALSRKREEIITQIDNNKLPLALNELKGIEGATSILTDDQVWDRVRANTKTPMDMKMLAEAQKTLIQNAQTLTQMNSINTDGAAGEFYFNLAFGTGSQSTQVVVSSKNNGGGK